VNYWSQQGGHPDGDTFRAAFTRGWDDALLFLSSPGVDELGFVAQWSRRRREQYEAERGGNKLGDNAWQWDHAFQQGVDAASAASQ